MTPRSTLDVWAILALLQGEEPAASRIKELFDAASKNQVELSISLINLGEVVYRLGKSKGEKEGWETLNEIRQLILTVNDVDEEIVWSAVGLKIRYPISYADAFAAATARKQEAVLIAGDPELFKLSSLVNIEKLLLEK